MRMGTLSRAFGAWAALVSGFLLISGGRASEGDCPAGQQKFRGLCYEFVRQPQPWTLAQKHCNGDGGSLLHSMDWETKDFVLEQMEPHQAWWIGQVPVGKHSSGPSTNNSDGSLDWPSWLNGSGENENHWKPTDPFHLCTYIILDPAFQLVTTPNCNLWLHSICQREFQKKHEIRKRDLPEDVSKVLKNILTEDNNATILKSPKVFQNASEFYKAIDATLNTMRNVTSKIENVTTLAVHMLDRIEREIFQPTVEQKIKFIEILYNVTLRIQKTNYSQWDKNITANIVFTCASSMLQSAVSECSLPKLSKEQYSAMVNIMLKVLDAVSLLMDLPFNKTFIMRHPLISTFISTYKPKDLGNVVIKISEDAAQFKLPGSSDFLSELEMYDSVSIQMSSFSFNPFLGESDENITSTVASLSLRSKTSEIHLENLTESIQDSAIRFSLSPHKFLIPADKTHLYNNFQLAVPDIWDGADWVMFCIKILLPQINYDNSSWSINTSGNPVTSQFNITDSNSTVILAVEPNKNITIQVLLSSGYLPNATNYDYSKFLNWEPSDDSSVQVGYRWLLTPELLSVGSGSWHVLITPFNLSNGESVTLRVLIFTSMCTFWNSSSTSWSTYGCTVGLLSQPWLTECLCNHLTFFGSSFFVLPNQVDLSRTAEYFATVTKNPVVVILLSVFFGLYLITVIWAWNADKKALKKRKLTVLDDNHPCAQYYYMLKVETGHRSGAGTSAKVQATLLGSEDQSEPHHLNDPDKPVFERGGVDLFLLSTAFSLGELQNIRLWHDNTGGHPSCYQTLCPHTGENGEVYVDKVVVQDVQTRQCWHFLCSTWLSSSKGDRMTDRTFNPAKKNEITSFSNIFQSKATIGFRDEHIWISILDPPKRSPFTRVQRVSCCMCLLLCTMAINIIFFNLPADSSSPVLISIGSLKITWQEIMIGIESGLLMFPINILIITIFRNIRPRQSQARDKKKDTEESSPESPTAATLNTLLEDAEELVTTLSKNKKNNVAALENRMESWEDLCSALECVNGVIQRMQDGSSTDLHWTFCSQFVLCSLHCLAETLGKVGVKAFPSPVEHRQVQDNITQMVKQVEMVCSSLPPLSSSPAPEKKTSSGCWLPWWFVFVGWFLLISISGVSTFFTLLYGFFYGKDSSIKWVMSLALSLFQSIFILQPLKVVGLAIFFALILKPVEQVDSDEVEQVLAEQRKKNKKYCGKGVP